MPSDRITRWTARLGGTLGVLYFVLGVVETITHLDEPISLVFWIPALFGGGMLVLVGVFWVTTPGWLSIGLVAVGLFATSLATAWTVIIPLATIALFVLVILRGNRPDAFEGRTTLP